MRAAMEAASDADVWTLDEALTKLIRDRRFLYWSDWVALADAVPDARNVPEATSVIEMLWGRMRQALPHLKPHLASKLWIVVAAAIRADSAETLRALLETLETRRAWPDAKAWDWIIQSLHQSLSVESIDVLVDLLPRLGGKLEGDELIELAQTALDGDLPKAAFGILQRLETSGEAFLPRSPLDLLRDVLARKQADGTHRAMLATLFRLGARVGTRFTLSARDNLLESCARMAVAASDESLLSAVFETLERLEGFFLPEVWGVIAKDALAAAKPDRRIAHLLWVASASSSKYFGASEKAAFAAFTRVWPDGPWAPTGRKFSSKANGPQSSWLTQLHNGIFVGDPAAITAAFGKMFASKTQLKANEWRDLIDFAQVSRGVPTVIRALWEGAATQTNVPLKPFFALVQNVGDAELLGELFDAWRPEAGTLERPKEHSIWSGFLTAAQSLRDESLLFRIVCRLESLFDPTRHPGYGTLQEQLSDIRDSFQDQFLGAEVRALLYGHRWNPDDFLTVLNGWPPARVGSPAGRFEGAARSLMKWLINHSFLGVPEDYNRALRRVAKGLHSLPRHRRAAWCAFLGHGLGNVGGNALTAYRKEFAEQFEGLNSINGAKLQTAIGKLPERINSFLAKHPFEEGVSPPREPAEPLSKLIWRINSALAATDGWRKLDGESLHRDLPALMAAARLETLPPEESGAFLRRLISQLTDTMRKCIDRYAGGILHDAKNRIVREYIPDINSALESGNQDEAQTLAERARAEVLSVHLLLPSRRVGEPQPIAVWKPVRHSFVTERMGGLCGASQIEFMMASTPYVAGFGNAKREVLSPLVRELLRNCQRALLQVPVDRRFVRISLLPESDTDGEYVALEIVNACDPKAASDRYSSGYGQKLLGRMAAAFHNGTIGGDVSCRLDGCDPLTGRAAYHTVVRFPRWLGDLPPNAVNDPTLTDAEDDEDDPTPHAGY